MVTLYKLEQRFKQDSDFNNLSKIKRIKAVMYTTYFLAFAFIVADLFLFNH